MTETHQMMVDQLQSYIDRVKAGEIEALGVVAVVGHGTVSHAYVMPTDDEDPITLRLVEATQGLLVSLSPANCGSCGGVHRGLLCPHGLAESKDFVDTDQE